ncbi:MAG: SLC13 family permease [Muribaculaceae bacterium]|nr:SLC13 family permease [Muribaculaceae bacterium]
MLITLITLLAAGILFVWGKLRSDIVALLALLVLAVSGIITPAEALSGFSNSIVIMMVGLFVVGGAIFNTGLAKIIGAKLIALSGDSPMRLFLLVMAGTAFIGAFVSNTGTVALMLPIVVSMASTSGASASRLLMPLAFASSMGGMLTLIGTPPNLVISEVWEEAGHEPLSFFTFLPGGLICVTAGTLLLIPLSKWFLSKKSEKDTDSAGKPKSLAQLVEEYGLLSNLYRLSVMPASVVAGKSIAQLNLRQRFGIDVLEVRSGDNRGIVRKVKQQAAAPDTILRAGDYVYIRGTEQAVRTFASECGLEFDGGDDSAGSLEFYDIGIAEIVLMPNSPIINKSIAEIGFRHDYGVNVLAIRRKSTYLTENLAAQAIRPGDVLLVQGSWGAIGRLSSNTAAWVVLGQPLAEASKVTLDYKAPLAAVIMLAMIVMLVFDFIAPVLTVLAASVLMILAGCFRNVEDAYRKINWESVVLIGAMMPMSFALEKTGISAMVADGLIDGLGSLGPVAVMAGIYFTTSAMTLFISNTATAVLLAPIAMQSAVGLGVSPLPFLFAVTFGASLCFASPFSTPPNALVMPAGQYVFSDYIKVGLPLQIILGLLMVAVLPLLFPF